MSSEKILTINGRQYAWAKRPVVVVCIDGSEPYYEGCDHGGYIERAVAAGCMPFTKGMLASGTNRLAKSVIPAFTNPNNLSIATGAPPALHGICGNFFYDQDQDAEVLMNDPVFLRTGTIFSAFADAGARVAVVTAKDKLRRLLGDGLKFGEGGSICFSAEHADQANLAHNGIKNVLQRIAMPLPSVYSAELSEVVFAAGVNLLKTERPDIMYLSTTDYIQHKFAPGSAGANAFYAMMDGYWQQLDGLGATLALTADHGMKTKHTADGDADVIYLQSLLDDWLGTGLARVILPITDPYVIHHGALGGFATAYVPETINVADLINKLMSLEGVECALDKASACERFELPADRLGDVVVITDRNKVVGTVPERHDLSQLKEPLRSHGGLSEQKVPFILNRATPDLASDRRLRNFDILDVALNYTV